MALKVKQLCKERNMTLAELAAKLDITPVTLSQTLNGNPTLSRLTSIAEALDVDVSELFQKPIKKGISGCVFVDEQPFIINDEKGFEALVEAVKKRKE